MERIYYQQQDQGCGYACVKMMLAHYSHKNCYGNIIEPKVRKEPPNLNEIITFGKKYGLQLQAFKVDKKECLLRECSYPILLIIEENSLTHMIYVYKRKGNFIYYFDPAKGKERKDINKLTSLLTGVYLKGYLKYKNIKVKNHHIINPIYRIIVSLFEVASLALLFIGFYFISDEGNFLAPLLSFIGFALIKIIQRITLVLSMKKFDEKYINNVDKIQPNLRESKYREFLDYKSRYFNDYMSIFSILIEIITIGLLLSFNDFYYCVLSLISVFVLTGYFAASKPYKDKRIKEIENEEAIYLGRKSTIERENTSKKLFHKTYLFGLREGLEELILIFSDLSICLLLCLFNENISLNYLLFSVLSLYYLQSRFLTFLNKINSRDEYQRIKAKFIGRFDPKV